MNRVYKLNVPPAAVGASLLIAYALSWLAAPYVIKSAYHGESMGFLNNVISGKGVLPVEFYLEIANRQFRQLFLPAVLVGIAFLYLGTSRVRLTVSNTQHMRLFPYLIATIPAATGRRTPARQFWKVFLLIFLLSIFLLTAVLALHGYAANSGSKIGDWLINYQGGFVRRGLTGEMFFRLSSWTGIPPANYVMAAQIGCYFTYFLFAGLMLAKQPRPLGYLLLVVSPFIFLFQVHDVQGGFRKEIIYFALLAFFAWASSSMRENRFEKLSTVVLVSCPLIILSHEMLAVFLPYVVAVYASRSPSCARSVLKVIVCLVLSIIVFASTLINSGDSAQVSAICASLSEYAPHDCEETGSIGGLRRGTGYAMKYVGAVVGRASYFDKYSLVIALSAIAYLPILGKLRTMARSRPLLVLVGVSALGTVPLFFVAIDWGRIIYIHLVSLFLLTLILDSDREGSPTRIQKAAKRKFILVDRTDRNGTVIVAPAPGVVLLVICVLGYASLWRIDHCCGGDLLHNNFLRVWTEFPERLFRYFSHAGMG